MTNTHVKDRAESRDRSNEEELPSYIAPQTGGVVLKVLLQPRASKNEVTGTQDGRLKLRLKAPPVDGEANKALIAYLAKFFDIKKVQIEITAGLSSRRKTVLIKNATLKALSEKINL